jgi:hypothetical protein
MRRLVGAVAVDHDAAGTRVVLEHPLAHRGAALPVGSRVVEGTGC